VNELIELNPTEVAVNEELPRVRQDMQDIQELANSITKFGQLEPILINRKHELVAGGRRLAACTILGRKVVCIYNDAVDKDTMREIEIEENLQRKDFTPAEEVLAIEELHRIKVLHYGEVKPGPKIEGEVENKGWTLEDTAEVMGKTEGNVRAALKMAEMIHNFPELKDAKSKKDIVRAAKGIEQVARRVDALTKYNEMTKTIELPVRIEQSDARIFMPKIPDKSVDLLLTDPIYGIDIDDTAIGIGGVTGGTLTTSGFTYEDDYDEAISLYEALANESFRFCKDNAHAWVFIGPGNFWTIREIFQKAGWLVHVKPFVWIKGLNGQANNPDKWPVSAYEMCLFARKYESRLVIEGKVDWMQTPRVNVSEKRHGAEKPLSLARELILRTTLPGMLMADPFMGSGTFVEAACENKLAVLACDIAYESYTCTVERIGQWKERKDQEK
jgi:DNA modification methylase